MKWKNILSRVVKKVYPRFGLRDSDIFLASYPKSGNTWVRFIWTNIISVVERGGEKVTFHTVTDELGAEYDVNSYPNEEIECLPRIVKTHKKYNSYIFSKNKSVYLLRNPGDVMI